jgi:hypothetical protein
LGEFSPIEPLFALGSLLEITKVGQLWGQFFSYRKSFVFIIEKNGFWLHFGRLFHKLIWSPCQRPCFISYYSAPFFQLFFSSTTLLTGMTGIPLHW